MADRTQSGRSSMEAVLTLDSLLVYSIMHQTHFTLWAPFDLKQAEQMKALFTTKGEIKFS